MEDAVADDFYRQFFHHAESSFSILRPVDAASDFAWVEINDSEARLGNLPREEYLGKRVSELFPATISQGFIAIAQAVLSEGTPVQLDPLPYEDDRIRRWVSVHAFPLPNEHVGVVITDAEQERSAEVELERSRRIEARTARLTRSGHWRYEAESDLIFWSFYLYELFGLDPANGPDYVAERALIHPEDREHHDAFAALLRQEPGRHVYEYRIVVDGTVRHLRSIAESEEAIEGRPVFSGVIQDVTEEVNARQELIDREARFSAIFNESPIGIVILDAQGNVVEMNDALGELFGMPDEMRAAVLSSYNVFDDPQIVRLGLRWFLERAILGEPVTTPIVRYDAGEMVRDQGKSDRDALAKWIQIRLFPLREPSGPQRFLVGLVEDVSERYETHLQHRRSMALFRSTADGVVITDLDGVITDVNPAFTEITGWKPHEVIGHNPRILQSATHDDDFYTEMWRSLEAHGSWRGVITNRRKDGTTYQERLTITTIHDPDGLPEGYVGVFTQLG